MKGLINASHSLGGTLKTLILRRNLQERCGGPQQAPYIRNSAVFMTT